MCSRQITRCEVERVDADWIHGRSVNTDLEILRTKTVAVVGCGSLGGYIARSLVQAGVQNLILVDPDTLQSHNTSRHVLGQRYLFVNKSEAMALMLQRDFPHIHVQTFGARFEKLERQAIDALAQCDLILSAGIDLPGDASLNQWRLTLHHKPMYLCTWTEEYAACGHAVAMLETESLLKHFNSDGIPDFLLTDWPHNSTAYIEAGCGNYFQPYGAVELGYTVSLASTLALDMLLGKVPASCRRAWLGDRDGVVEKGGVPRPDFDQSFVIQRYQW